MITRATYLAGATAMVAGIAAVTFWKQLHEERLLSAQLQERVTQLEQSPPSAPAVAPQVAHSPTPDASAPSASATTAQIQPPGAGQPPLPGNPAPNVAVISSAAMNLARDPDFCTAQKATMRARMIQTYPDAAKVLNLSPTESSALTELLLKHQESGLNCDPEEAGSQPRLAGKALADAQHAEIEALLGPAKFHEFQEYLPTREGRLNVNRLRDAVSTTDTPLTDQQAGPLLDSVLAERKRFTAEAEALAPPSDARSNIDYQEARLRLTEESNARLIASAEAYLTPRQLAVMKNSMTAVNSRQRALLRAQRAQIDAGNGPPMQIQGSPR